MERLIFTVSSISSLMAFLYNYNLTDTPKMRRRVSRGVHSLIGVYVCVCAIACSSGPRKKKYYFFSFVLTIFHLYITLFLCIIDSIGVFGGQHDIVPVHLTFLTIPIYAFFRPYIIKIIFTRELLLSLLFFY